MDFEGPSAQALAEVEKVLSARGERTTFVGGPKPVEAGPARGRMEEAPALAPQTRAAGATRAAQRRPGNWRGSRDDA